MTSTATRRQVRTPHLGDRAPDRGDDPSPSWRLLGRLGVWLTDEPRLVTGVRLPLIIGPGRPHRRSSATCPELGWQADGSESVAARRPRALPTTM
jgi:putative drug exporter of the RND superfamily